MQLPGQVPNLAAWGEHLRNHKSLSKHNEPFKIAFVVHSSVPVVPVPAGSQFPVIENRCTTAQRLRQPFTAILEPARSGVGQRDMFIPEICVTQYPILRLVV